MVGFTSEWIEDASRRVICVAIGSEKCEHCTVAPHGSAIEQLDILDLLLDDNRSLEGLMNTLSLHVLFENMS